MKIAKLKIENFVAFLLTLTLSLGAFGLFPQQVHSASTPTFESVATNTGKANGSVSAPSGITTGELLIWCIGFEKGSSSTIGPPTGFTLIQRINSGTDNGGACYYKVAVTADESAGSYSFTVSQGAKWGTGMALYAGNDTTDPIDVSTTNSGSGSSQTAASLTTTVDNTRVVHYYTAKSAATYTPDADYALNNGAERWDAPNTGEGQPANMGADFEQVSAGSTGTYTSTGPAEIWETISFAIAPAADAELSVVTDAATGVGVSSATLNGTITIGGENANERGFAWGTNSALDGGDTATTTEFGSFGSGSYSTAVETLQSGTTYYFRAFAADTTGTTTGSILNFTAGTDTTPRRTLRLFEGYRIKVNEGGRIIIYGQ